MDIIRAAQKDKQTSPQRHPSSLLKRLLGTGSGTKEFILKKLGVRPALSEANGCPCG